MSPELRLLVAAVERALESSARERVLTGTPDRLFIQSDVIYPRQRAASSRKYQGRYFKIKEPRGRGFEPVTVGLFV